MCLFMAIKCWAPGGMLYSIVCYFEFFLFLKTDRLFATEPPVWESRLLGIRSWPLVTPRLSNSAWWTCTRNSTILFFAWWCALDTAGDYHQHWSSLRLPYLIDSTLLYDPVTGDLLYCCNIWYNSGLRSPPLTKKILESARAYIAFRPQRHNMTSTQQQQKIENPLVRWEGAILFTSILDQVLPPPPERQSRCYPSAAAKVLPTNDTISFHFILISFHFDLI